MTRKPYYMYVKGTIKFTDTDTTYSMQHDAEGMANPWSPAVKLVIQGYQVSLTQVFTDTRIYE